MTDTRTSRRAALLLLTAALSSVACGKKGPLYLPEEARAPAAQVAAGAVLPAARDRNGP